MKSVFRALGKGGKDTSEWREFGDTVVHYTLLLQNPGDGNHDKMIPLQNTRPW